MCLGDEPRPRHALRNSICQLVLECSRAAVTILKLSVRTNKVAGKRHEVIPECFGNWQIRSTVGCREHPKRSIQQSSLGQHDGQGASLDSEGTSAGMLFRNCFRTSRISFQISLSGAAGEAQQKR